MLESELLPPLIRHFAARGLRTVPEVAVSGHRADLVAVSDDAFVAVEVKVSRWPQALRQAIAYQVWAPLAYIALPFPPALRASRHRHRFEAEGVGILAVLGDEVRTFFPATASQRLFPALSDLIRCQLIPPSKRLDAFPSGTGERFYGESRM